ncbi:DUF4258 domain-containing protein [Roseomonas stagni]|uniref:DUF4258 domain-containing protein n=1 Tax=Falsiroseomonas algicola TaxID=2716930 RepID=A0A6M1LR51_9PROT|nr:DUF4258 domain-containing protein [Falsiroseomonas algicola]NGM22911.1 DUF4258 domain-containing protein [Falsiroseomonas algicola]
MIRLSIHAEQRLRERGIPLAWIEVTITEPDRTSPDASDPTLLHAFRAIDAAGGRVLKVVHRVRGGDILVVTAHLDRGASR